MTCAINHEAWARNMITFLRERGLESDFKDWCGGWPCPIASHDGMTTLHEIVHRIREGTFYQDYDWASGPALRVLDAVLASSPVSNQGEPV